MLNAKTKIVVTLGPASANREVLAKLFEAGVSVVRLNCSHGTTEDRSRYLQLVREVAGNRPIAVMADLCGPKIRIDKIENNAMPLIQGDVVTIQRENLLGRNKTISSNYASLVDDLQVGQRVLIDDGAIRLLVTEKLTDRVRCQVVQGGLLSSNKGLNLPNTNVQLPSITEKDWADVEWGVANGVDYIALSFVRKAEDIKLLRSYLENRECKIGIVSKIEMPEAVDNLASIIEVSDVILVARGDLGVEMDLTSLPLIQKQIVTAAQEAGKPAIVATQMLQSMVESPMPTRAEVTDVANAILDGADAVMLSGETAVGKFPVSAVMVLQEIAKKTEDYIIRKGIETHSPKLLQRTHHRTAAIAHGARSIVADVNAKLMVVWSQAGGSARYLSKNRIPVQILAFSTDPRAVRRMAMYFGVYPIHAQIPDHFDDLPLMIDRILLGNGWAEPNDRIVIAAGSPLGIIGVTNSLSVHTVGMAAS